jgi:IclR family pca regulon transcriptional regulator
MQLATTIIKGFKILEAFSTEKPRMVPQEIEKQTGLPRATAYRFLRTFLSLKYLKYDRKTGEYSLGPNVMSLGFVVLSSLDMRHIAYPYLKELSQKTGLSVNMGILDDTEVVYIERAAGKRIQNIEYPIGSRFKAYNTAMGRAILAHLDKDEFLVLLKDILADEKAIELVGAKGERLVQKLQNERKKGYAINDQELCLGVRAIGAPIFNAKGKVDAAINLPVFNQFCNKKKLIKEYAPLLLKTANIISISRGFKVRPSEYESSIL